MTYFDQITPFHRSRAVTLFSGLGSSSEALRSLGFDVLPHDLMPEAVESLLANGFHEAQCIDVREIDYRHPRYRGVEVVAGGPPCQPFSQSANNDGQYDARDMIPEFVRAVAELLPKLFVMEEVQTLTWKKHADYLARVTSDLEALGYRVEGRVLNAADYFLPQARKRLFLVGVREDIAQAREALPFGDIQAIMWPEKSEVRQTMSEALEWDRFEAYRRNLACPEPAHVDGPFDPRLDWVFERPAPTVVGSYRPDVAASPGYRKAGDGPRQNQPGSVSTTLEERLLLQGLPIGWKVCGPKAKQDLQVGNSVPMPLIRELIDVNLP